MGSAAAPHVGPGASAVGWHRSPLTARPAELLRPYLAEGRWEQVRAARDAGRRTLAGRRVWVLNTSPVGGGVAQLIRTLTPYWIDAGADVRWLLLDAPADFFRVTKGLHNLLHGQTLDGPTIGPADVALYDAVTGAAAQRLLPHVRRGDIVVLHDPQTAGLTPALAARGAVVLWRCHVGADRPNRFTDAAWDVLAPRVAQADAAVFTIGAFVPARLSSMPSG